MEEGCIVEGYTVDEDGGIVRMARLAEDSEETDKHNMETSVAMPTVGLGLGYCLKIGFKSTELSGKNITELMLCHSTC
jgi:hypothetical protein